MLNFYHRYHTHNQFFLVFYSYVTIRNGPFYPYMFFNSHFFNMI